eukprot:448944-Prymnesium_polylepis.1
MRRRRRAGRRTLLDNQHALGGRSLAVEAQPAGRLHVAPQREDGRIQRLRRRTLLQQRDAARHAASRRGDHAERLARARHAGAVAHDRADLEHLVVHVRRRREELGRLESVPEFALRHLLLVCQALVHGGEHGPELAELDHRRARPRVRAREDLVAPHMPHLADAAVHRPLLVAARAGDEADV